MSDSRRSIGCGLDDASAVNGDRYVADKYAMYLSPWHRPK